VSLVVPIVREVLLGDRDLVLEVGYEVKNCFGGGMGSALAMTVHDWSQKEDLLRGFVPESEGIIEAQLAYCL